MNFKLTYTNGYCHSHSASILFKYYNLLSKEQKRSAVITLNDERITLDYLKETKQAER